MIRLPLVFGSQDIMKTFGMIDLISNMEPADDVNKVLYARPTHVAGVCAATYPHSTHAHVPNYRYTMYGAYVISSNFCQSKVNK